MHRSASILVKDSSSRRDVSRGRAVTALDGRIIRNSNAFWTQSRKAQGWKYRPSVNIPRGCGQGGRGSPGLVSCCFTPSAQQLRRWFSLERGGPGYMRVRHRLHVAGFRFCFPPYLSYNWQRDPKPHSHCQEMALLREGQLGSALSRMLYYHCLL